MLKTRGVDVLKFSRKTTIVVSTMALVIATSVAAFAFWTGIGSGGGSAQAATSPASQLIVNQTSTTGGLEPGGPEGTLAGDFNNPNTSGVFVNTVKATIASVTHAAGLPVGSPPNPCTVTDFELTDDTAEVGATIPPGNPSGAWTGIKIRMKETGVNQDNCKGATVNLNYTIA
jgi:hypothetical protein